MMNDLTSRSEYTIEMLQGAIEDLKPLEPSYYVQDDTYIGSSISGEMTLSTDGADLFKDLLKETATEFYLQDSSGNTYKGSYHREIKNIHRVRKGKRYIVKFDYTGNCIFEGVRI